jgi:hypothetical protein
VWAAGDVGGDGGASCGRPDTKPRTACCWREIVASRTPQSAATTFFVDHTHALATTLTSVAAHLRGLARANSALNSLVQRLDESGRHLDLVCARRHASTHHTARRSADDDFE